MDLFKPRGASAPRRPTDNNQQNGQIYNTPRYAEFGGLSGPTKYSKNQMTLEKQPSAKTGRKVI
jgi:hypothetical protein